VVAGPGGAAMSEVELRKRNPMDWKRLLVVAVVAAMPWAASAAVPTTAPLDGRLLTAGGGPVSDGDYTLTFALYAAADATATVWSEQVAKVAVKGGAFSHELGAGKPLGQGVLAAPQGLWLGVTVGSEPELPKTPLRSVLYARRAELAEGLQCAGCVDSAMLGPQVLAGYAKSADLSGYVKLGDLSEYVKASALAKVAVTGSYTDLAELPVVPKVDQACGSSLVVKGLKVDGSLDCVAAVASIAGVNCALGSVVTGFSAVGVPVCSKLGEVTGGPGVITVYLEPAGCGNHITTTPTCLAVACDYADGVNAYWNCKGTYCNNLPPSKCPTTLLGTLMLGP
jgi:hypothetical protein